MSGTAQVDWFAQNAPTQPSAQGQDWFASNAPGAAEKATAQPDSIAQKAVDVLAPPIGLMHEASAAVSSWAAKKAAQYQQEEEAEVAKTGQQPSTLSTYFGRRAAMDMLSHVAGLNASATSPAGLAVIGATVAVPEVMGPALMAHGAYGAIKNAPGALEGNPDAVEAALSGASEAAGGAAATGAAFQAGGGPLTQLARQKAAGIGSTIPAARANVMPPAGQMQPALANTPEEVVNYAESKGINLTRGQATQLPLPKSIEAIGERSVVGENDLAEAKQAEAQKLADNVRNFDSRMDPFDAGSTEEDAGQTIKQATQVGKEIANQNASDAYKQLPQSRMQDPIDVSQIRSAYFSKLKQMEVSLANRNPQVAAQVRGVLEQGANLGTPATGVNGQPYVRPELTFQDLMKVRSDAIQDGGALVSQGAPSEVQGLYRGLASDADKVMADYAQKNGFAQDWRNANAGWRDYLNKYDNTQSPLRQILDRNDPSLVTRQILARGSPQDISLFKQEFSAPDGTNPVLEALRGQVVQDLANRGFRVNGDGLGGYSHSFLEQLFGADNTKELYLNGELARRMGYQQNPSGTSNVMLTEDQLSRFDPRKLIVGKLAAKASMPQTPTNFLPGAKTPLKVTTPAALLKVAPIAALSANDSAGSQ